MQLKHGLLALAMLATGALNTLLLKDQDKQCIANCPGANVTAVDASEFTAAAFALQSHFTGPNQMRSYIQTRSEGEEKPKEGKAKPVYWEQPIIQTLFMFVGETLCLGAFHVGEALKKRKRKDQAEDHERKPLLEDSTHKAGEPAAEAENGGAAKEVERIPLTARTRFLFFIPTLFDLAATSMMNYGLILVAASVYQMLRGAVVLFTAAFSILFLRRRLNVNNWIGLFLVVSGVTLVGLSSILFNPDASTESENAVLGVVLVIAAQMFTACQFVFEEKVLHKYYAPPLEAVGYEGLFGLVSIAVLAPILYFSAGQQASILDIKTGFEDFSKYPRIWGPGIGSIFTIAFFNFFGLAITRAVSATARSTIDTTRTVLIWVVSLAVGWETFIWPQIIGFLLLVSGTFIYNEIIKVNTCCKKKTAPPAQVEDEVQQ